MRDPDQLDEFKIPKLSHDGAESYWDGFVYLLSIVDNLHYQNNPTNNQKQNFINLKMNLVEGMDLELAALRSVVPTTEEEKKEFSSLEKQFTDLRQDFITFADDKINSTP